MRIQRASLLAAVGLLLSIALLMSRTPIAAQTSATQRPGTGAFTDGDWPRYTGDLAGTRFSKLKQINTTNVATLKQAWTFPSVGGQETPIVVDGVMYLSTASGAVAVDADTGKEIWRYGPPPAAGGAGGGRGARGGGAPGAAAPGGVPPVPAGQAGAAPAAGRGGRGGAAAAPATAGNTRGVAYWPGDATHPARILIMAGRNLVALDATTGALDPTFGTRDGL
jgi:glucose dehydrogenase